ncbi:MAG: hypothetical protein AAFQ82_20990, partial [Myxococcota bacterium]
MLWFILLTVGAPNGAEVELPLQQWNAMRDELRALREPGAPPAEVAALERTVRGEFRKGLFEGTLETRVEVLDADQPVRVPVLDVGASIQTVTVNGVATSLRREGAFYSVELASPGTNTIRVRFLWGEEQDRFARRLRFSLPAAGPTRLDVLIPETEIDADLQGGALLDSRESGTNTRIIGQLDAVATVNLAWRRRLEHNEGG